MYETTPNWYQELFEKLGKNYLAFPFTRGTIEEVDFIVALLGLSKGAKILDVGCGAGRHSIELAIRGYQVTGLDYSHRMIEIANEKAKQQGVSSSSYMAMHGTWISNNGSMLPSPFVKAHLESWRTMSKI